MYVTSKKATMILGMHPNTLRKYAKNGKIKFIRNEAKQRLYDITSYIRRTSNASIICYCRVSSTKQKDDLARQIVFMQEKFPKAEIIKDVGSGINFKRKGLRTILERLLCGYKLTIIVAHRDRLARFGFDLIKYMVEQNGGELLVLDKIEHSPQQELATNFISILHVFSCRMHRLRSYTEEIKKDKNLCNQ